MSTPSSGITAEVMRDILHPYHLSADPLEATLADIPATHPDQDTGPEWSITKLDESPGWSGELLRHRTHREPANTAKPESTP
jgi:hypothetical protein